MHLEWLNKVDPAAFMMVGFLVFVFGISILVTIYQSIPCRWGGPHDWQNIGEPARISVNAGTLHIYNKVCLACEKINMEAEPYLIAKQLEIERLKARQQRAEAIVKRTDR